MRFAKQSAIAPSLPIFGMSLAIFGMSLAIFGSSHAWSQQQSTSTETPAETLATSGTRLVRSEANLSTQANHLNQNQWIRLTDEGSIRGSLTTIIGSEQMRQAKARVTLVQDGNIVYQGQTDVDGDFIFENAKPGVYSLVANGETQLAICSVTVLTGDEGAHLPDRLHVHSLSPALKRVSELIRSNTMPTWTAGSQPTTDPIATTRSSPGSCVVQIDSRGGISGTLSRANTSVDLSGTVVYLFRDGREIGRTRVASNGDYRLDGVKAGGYGLVASGPEGIVAVGFSAISKDLAFNARSSKFVNRLGQDSSEPIPAAVPQKLNVELAEPNCYVPVEVIPIEECVMNEVAPCCPTMCGSWGGGFGGGGGGGGGHAGSGGLGSLAAIGALGAVAIVAADNGNEAPIVSKVQ
jgi:hypothetical protein